jgi:hypothetical protein
MEEAIQRPEGHLERLQLTPRGGKRHWAKVLRKVSVPPITFRCSGIVGISGDCGDSGGLDSAGSKCGFACLALHQLATRPSAPCFEGFARSVVFRVLFLEIREQVLRAIGGPERQGLVVLFIELLGVFNFPQDSFCLYCVCGIGFSLPTGGLDRFRPIHSK